MLSGPQNLVYVEESGTEANILCVYETTLPDQWKVLASPMDLCSPTCRKDGTTNSCELRYHGVSNVAMLEMRKELSILIGCAQDSNDLEDMVTRSEAVLRQKVATVPEGHKEDVLSNYIERAIVAVQVTECALDLDQDRNNERENQTRDMEHLVQELSRRTENLRLHDSSVEQSEQSVQSSTLESDMLPSDSDRETDGLWSDDPRDNFVVKGPPSLIWETDSEIKTTPRGVTDSGSQSQDIADLQHTDVGRIIGTILTGVYDSPGGEEAPFAARRKLVIKALVPVWRGVKEADKYNFLYLCNVNYLHLEMVKRGEVRPPCLQIDELDAKIQNPSLDTPQRRLRDETLTHPSSATEMTSLVAQLPVVTGTISSVGNVPYADGEMYSANEYGSKDWVESTP
ncbi:MAG: hypothetical protein GY702_24170, partial [Desulfobulbaceae bacterium]|nr:hypothetical protein [Desulfobulbaceae bacterium]